MSDDLIKRLRKSVWTLDQAEDRIEQLEENNKELTMQLLAAHGQAADALDKLAKTVEALRFISQMHGYTSRQLSDLARTKLAELEGGNEPDQKQGG
jgi:multidrug resistance efflux pump